ncbi:hypothetical protein [Candidatus Odyssella thessalonicensis]|uniref:hypothetical protein n=1 Tax=Candidatus Odyssella thessalonicensis TaxID=84647 RepID=UPI000225C096|nr:hypothetical protein [Candidatus Odyssella thessalonicensis]
MRDTLAALALLITSAVAMDLDNILPSDLRDPETLQRLETFKGLTQLPTVQAQQEFVERLDPEIKADLAVIADLALEKLISPSQSGQINEGERDVQLCLQEVGQVRTKLAATKHESATIKSAAQVLANDVITSVFQEYQRRQGTRLADTKRAELLRILIGYAGQESRAQVGSSTTSNLLNHPHNAVCGRIEECLNLPQGSFQTYEAAKKLQAVAFGYYSYANALKSQQALENKVQIATSNLERKQQQLASLKVPTQTPKAAQLLALHKLLTE